MPLLGLLTSVSSPFSMLKIYAFGSFLQQTGRNAALFLTKNEIIAIAGKRIFCSPCI